VHVVYCYGKDCHEADQLQETLKAVGFKQAFVMTSSVEEWKAAGLPTE
jgi:3-mercaptopyruvate sulfurtransferase SseA